MKKYLIVTDNSSELSEEECQKYGIFPQLIPLTVAYDGEPVAPEYLEPDRFYQALEEDYFHPGMLKTSSASIIGIADVLLRAAKVAPRGITIVYAGISEQLSSGTTSAAAAALEICRDECPDVDFFYCPTYCISNGLGLMLQELARYDGEDIIDYAEVVGQRIAHLFTIEDLSYAAKSGRFSFRQLAGLAINKTLHRSPSMYFPCDANLQSCGPLLPLRKMICHWAEYYEEHAASFKLPVRIGYAGDKELFAANYLKSLLIKLGVSEDKIQVARIGAVVGAHCGPTIISFFFRQKEVRDSSWHNLHH